jgi:hypothetical protein
VNSQASSRELYHIAAKRLHAMSIEADRLKDDVDEATFLHDMLIRLKLWAADVDEKSLEWADKIDPVVAELKPLLVQLNQEIQAFERSSTTAVSSELPGMMTPCSPFAIRALPHRDVLACIRSTDQLDRC